VRKDHQTQGALQIGISKMKQISYREKILVLSVCAIIIIFNPMSFDPYNSLKLTILILSSSIILLNFIFEQNIFEILKANKIVTFITGFFLLSLIISVAFTSNDFIQSLVGAYGRNNGLLSWFALLVFFLVGSHSQNLNLGVVFLKGIVVTGLVVGIYAWSQYTNFDVIRLIFDWFNQERRVHATFGNTNLFSAFAAIILVASLGSSINTLNSKTFRFLSISTFFIYLPFIPRIDFQGRLIAIFCIALFLGIWLWMYPNKWIKRIGFFWMSIFSSCVFLVTFAFFKLGPLSQLLVDYLPSLQDRIFFWRAAMKIISDKPYFGIGIDEMDYWYREYRLKESVGFRAAAGEGVDNVHNSFLQIGATTGILSLVGYLSLVIFIGWCITRALKIHKGSFHLITLIFVWFAYTIQSLVSFDNLGIMVIGWSVAGILVGLSKVEDAANINTTNPKSTQKKYSPTPQRKFFQLILWLVLISQVWVASSYQKNDILLHAQWWSIREKLELNQSLSIDQINRFVSETLKSSQSRKRMRVAEQLIAVGLIEPALQIAVATTRDYPKEIRGWETSARIFIAQGDLESAAEASSKLIELDPLNDELKVKFLQYTDSGK